MLHSFQFEVWLDGGVCLGFFSTGWFLGLLLGFSCIM